MGSLAITALLFYSKSFNNNTSVDIQTVIECCKFTHAVVDFKYVSYHRISSVNHINYNGFYLNN